MLWQQHHHEAQHANIFRRYHTIPYSRAIHVLTEQWWPCLAIGGWPKEDSNGWRSCVFWAGGWSVKGKLLEVEIARLMRAIQYLCRPSPWQLFSLDQNQRPGRYVVKGMNNLVPCESSQVWPMGIQRRERKPSRRLRRRCQVCQHPAPGMHFLSFFQSIQMNHLDHLDCLDHQDLWLSLSLSRDQYPKHPNVPKYTKCPGRKARWSNHQLHTSSYLGLGFMSWKGQGPSLQTYLHFKNQPHVHHLH